MTGWIVDVAAWVIVGALLWSLWPTAKEEPMEIGLTVGSFVVGGAVGFLAACLCKAAEHAEPHAIPRGEDPFTRNTVTRPPRRTPAVLLTDPLDSATWDSD